VDEFRELISKVKALEVRTVLERRGLAWKRRRFVCPGCGHTGGGCSSHRGDDRRWTCHSCGRGGSSLDLVLLLESIDPEDRLSRQAVEVLEREAGEALPPPRSREEVRRQERPGMSERELWRWWQTSQEQRPEAVELWLRETRGISFLPWLEVGEYREPRQVPETRRPDIAAAVSAGVCAAVPLRSAASGRISNLIVRPLFPSVVAEGTDRPWKARALNTGAGSTRDGLLPMVYGDPRRALSAPLLLVCEGWVDSVTGAALLEALAVRQAAAVAAYCADDLSAVWTSWLPRRTGRRTVFLPHLDERQATCKPCGYRRRRLSRLEVPLLPGGGCGGCGGPVDIYRPGPDEMGKARESCPGGVWFHWRAALEYLGWTLERFQAAGLTDLNDCIRLDAPGPRAGFDRLVQAFKIGMRL